MAQVARPLCCAPSAQGRELPVGTFNPNRRVTLVLVGEADDHISSPQRQLWVSRADKNQSSRSERHMGRLFNSEPYYFAPSGARIIMDAGYPQLALWATNISLASPTGSHPPGGIVFAGLLMKREFKRKECLLCARV